MPMMEVCLQWFFRSDDAVGKHRVEYGQLSVLTDKHNCNLIETALMMNDAREIGVQVVCCWFEEDEVFFSALEFASEFADKDSPGMSTMPSYLKYWLWFVYCLVSYSSIHHVQGQSALKKLRKGSRSLPLTS